MLKTAFNGIKAFYTIVALVAFLSLNIDHLRAQHSSSLEVNGGAGKMLDIFVNFPQRSLHQQLSLNYSWQGSGAYAQAFGNHENQVRLSIHDFGNDTVLGRGVGLQYHLRLIKQLKHIAGFMSFGFGGVYCTNAYDYLRNRNNIVLGSRVQALVSGELGLLLPLSRSWQLGVSASIWHSSNMHVQLPNVGLNTPMFNVHAKYSWTHAAKANSVQQIKNQREWNVRYAWGLNEAGTTIRPTNGPKYNKYIAVIGYSYRFRTIHRLSIDIEAYYDQAYRMYNEIGQHELNHPRLQSSAVMLMIGHEFIYDHFGLVVHAGLNVYNPTINYLYREIFSDGGYSLGQLIPLRMAARYYFLLPENNRVAPYLQFGVKSNFGLADYMELGLGFILPTRPKTG